MARTTQRAKTSADSKSPSVAITDPRFINIQTDPRFRLPSKKHGKVKLDKRFAHMLKDDDFAKRANVDRYGRKIEKGTGKKELERFYQVDDEEDDGEDHGPAQLPSSGESVDNLDDDEDVLEELAQVDRKYDPAREGGFSESSSDEESSDEDEQELEIGEDDIAGDRNQDIPMGEVSSRLAAVNMDWDNVRAVDLMAVASSFTPADGRILKVTVYPSEFGQEQMEREELEGPPKELFTTTKVPETENESSEDESDDEKLKKRLLQEDTGEEYSSNALREYQLSRLRYYYAVLECSSTSIAKALYDAMDSREYLTTANFFDLRFIPDETTFDATPRDECTTIPEGYRPNEFTTHALTHSKVRLTWDADDTARKEVQKRAFSRGDLEENDLQAYIGSDSSSEGEPQSVPGATKEMFDGPFNRNADRDSEPRLSKAEQKRQRMRALLGLSGEETKSTKPRDQNRPVGDIQVTFTSGLSASNQGGSVFENAPLGEETTREKYIRKEKERKVKRRERALARRSENEEVLEGNGNEEDLTSGSEGEDDDGVVGISNKPAPKKAKDRKDAQPAISADPFDDPFFNEPTAISKPTASARKASKKAKRAERDAQDAANASKRAELELLLLDDESKSTGVDGGPGVRHFDMKEIERQEKDAKKRGKKIKQNQKNRDGIGDEGGNDGADGFQMNVSDPRFANLYDSHEFAIDPTNPRFRGTEGMKKLLEEGRKKRKDRGGGGEEETGKSKSNKKVKVGKEQETGFAEAKSREDLKKLVDRVKGNTRR
ncbi:MAG: pre-rRNA-processing protein esf1 [Bogoriella megaspora]|nr:MAG: pre-rRNA-processing protein esf1 [Bogoriella megaspora]